MSDRTHPRRRSSRGFSLIELIVVIGIIAVLIGLLFPMLQTARQHAIRVECMNNLRTIGHGLIMYNNEQKHLPLRFGHTAEDGTLWGYDEELKRMKTVVDKTMICPNHIDSGYYDEAGSQLSYGMNWYFDNQPITKGKSSDILVAEVAGWTGRGTHRADRDSLHPGQLELYRHRGTRSQIGRVNWLFFDGHVEWLTYDDASGPDKRNWGVDHGDHGSGGAAAY